MLIVEDGSIVAGANSFVTDVEFLAYALARGFTLPVLEEDRKELLIQAVDYLFSKENAMQGCRVSAAQELPYPRVGVCAYGFNVASNEIPKGLKNSQMELGIQANESSLLKSGTVQNLASFNVDGVYSESYFSGGNWEVVRTDRADAYLNPLLINGGSNAIMVRV